jgi:hypothetical protein
MKIKEFYMGKEKELLAKFVDLASAEFVNHGCNDVEDSFFDGWTIEERQAFVKEYHEWNGDPGGYHPDFLHLPDFAIMSFLADKLLRRTTADTQN